MHFEAAWLWWFMVPAVIYVTWLARHSYARLGRRSLVGATVLRLLLIALLIAAASRPELRRSTDAAHVVFLLDVSKSVSADNLHAALDKIEDTAVEMHKSHGNLLTSVIAFGEEPAVLVDSISAWSDWTVAHQDRVLHENRLAELYATRTQLVSSESRGSDEIAAIESRITEIEAFREDVVGDHTNLEAALHLAVNCGTHEAARTIVLLTDAQFNLGQGDEAWNRVAEAGVEIHSILLDRVGPPEVSVTDVRLPASVRVNQGFSATVHFASNVETKAQLVVYRDGVQVDERVIEIQPGEGSIQLDGLYFREKGFHRVEAAIRPEQDTSLRNNRVSSLVSIPGQTRVLYVDGDEDEMLYLKSALELEGMLVEARPSTGLPQSLSELLSFDTFILSNVPSDRLSRQQMQMIRSYVEDFGGGFIMLGGDESFGLGGYYDTPIETTLPIRMPIQKDLIRPSLALMLVIDKSGSMEGVKVELAKRAAIATSEAINPRDQIGLVGFDSASRVLLELTPASDRATISNRISALDAGGGTNMFPALRDAYERLQRSAARSKHVIVLSDGQTEGFGYEGLVRGMAADGITVSTIGIGEGADMPLLEAIAINGGGRSYFTNDFFSIPQIFTREALRASKNMLIERLTEPIVMQDDVTLRDLDGDALPLIAGYVATTPKGEADVILATDTGDPLLAKWRFGLGRSAAYTSDVKPRWSEDWIRWPDFPKFWAQLVRSVAGEDLAKEYAVDITHTRDGAGVRLRIDVRDAGGEFVHDLLHELTMVESGSSEVRDVRVETTAPGRLEAFIPRLVYGQDHQLAWHVGGRASPDPITVPYGFTFSYSPEFKSISANEEALANLHRRGSGQSTSVDGDASFNVRVGATRSIRLWPTLLAIALLVIPFDLLCRRLG